MDTSVAVAVHQLATSSEWFAGLVALLAQSGVFVLPVALLGVWLVADEAGHSRREAVLAGIAAAIVAVGVGLVLERVLARPRPFVELGFEPLFPHARDSSFPSDHTLVGVAFVGPMLWRARRLGIGLLVWALLVGSARVAAGVHFPSDIVGSAILGLALDALVWLAIGPLLRRFQLRRWSVAWAHSPPAAPPRSRAE